MQKFFPKFVLVSLVIALAAPLAPVNHAQDGANTKISANVPGVYFTVDGQNYTGAMSAFWPLGSKHTLFVSTPFQEVSQSGTRASFNGWTYGGGTLPGNPVVITADPNFASYQAVFDVQYALRLRFFSCPDPSYCNPPGNIYVNGTLVKSDTDIYLGAGSTAQLQAYPNPGYVFTGWIPGVNQSITGFVNSVTMNSPTSVYPQFEVVRHIHLDTQPTGLSLVADRAQVSAPVVMEWGWNTTHTVGIISPVSDQTGKYWVFSSWSDGGAPTHAYKVAPTIADDSITANFIPGAVATIATVPQGLKLKVDGRDNWPSYNFIWGAGETHHIEAPAQQTDDKGRVWQFAGWSNDGAAAQDIAVTDASVDTGIRVVATYNPVGHLTINSSMTSLTVKVDGQDCGIPCDVLRPVGTAVRVSAPASIPVNDQSRADFKGWPGSGTLAPDWSVTLGANPITTSADYKTMNKLSAAADPAEGAAWKLQPNSADGFYDALSIVNVAVSARPGYRFRSWTGDLAGSTPAGAVNMSTPRLVRAMLDKIPYIPPSGGVSNAAGAGTQDGVAPGSVVALFGASLAADTFVGPTSPLSQTLGGVTVRVGDRLLPLFFVSPQQINFILPTGTPEGEQVLTVSAAGQPDVRTTFNVARNAPGLFQQDVAGQSFALAIHEDGSAVTTDSPARQGELVTVYGTGFGPTDRPRLDGFPVPAAPAFNLVDSATVLVGDTSVDAVSAFAAPGRLGVDAVQFRLSGDAPTGTNATLRVRLNGQETNTLLLPIQ